MEQAVRLEHLQVSGFRGFAGEYDFDLSADVVLIYGPNGAGKTSLFDAVLWGLTGSVERFEGGDNVLVSRYSVSGEARVELILRRGDDESPLRIVRRYDGEQFLLVERESEQLTGPAAEAALLQVLWHAAPSANMAAVSLSKSVVRTIYLQQDQVRSFLNEEDEQSRFDIVSELLGTGRVREFVRQMERSRNRWTRETGHLRKELEQIERRRNALRDRVSAMEASASEASAIDEKWDPWVQEAVRALDRPVNTQGDRVKAIERVLYELRRAQRGAEDRLSRSQDLERIASEKPDKVLSSEVNEAQKRVAEAERIREESVERLEAALRRASEQRQKQVEAQQRRESMAALAQLALRHLDEKCPVCTQEYDIDHTRIHLKNILRETGSEVVSDSEDVSVASRVLGEAEQKLTAAQRSLRELKGKQRRYSDWMKSSSQVASELGIDEIQADLVGVAKRNVSAATEEIANLLRIRNTGESLTIDLARISELERLVDYRSLLRELEDDFDKQTEVIRHRQTASDNAKALHEALRSVSESLVTAELDRINPLLQQIYSSVDPHPSFRAVDFLSETYRGRGRFWARVTDAQRNDSVSVPGLVLSSSQMNVLAVVVFLAEYLS